MSIFCISIADSLILKFLQLCKVNYWIAEDKLFLKLMSYSEDHEFCSKLIPQLIETVKTKLKRWHGHDGHGTQPSRHRVYETLYKSQLSHTVCACHGGYSIAS